MPDHKRVLVVEDCPDMVQTLSVLLELWGHEVYSAHDGPSGLEAARAFRPDVVLLDIGLPHLDGFALARELREQEGLADVQLIAISGYGQATFRQQARNVGIDQYLLKPVEPEELQQLLACRRPTAADREEDADTPELRPHRDDSGTQGGNAGPHVLSARRAFLQVV
jgi:CheY-like chemotaxis protein